MRALLRWLLAVKGYGPKIERIEDEEEPFEGPGIGRGLYQSDANFILNERRLRFHEDVIGGPEPGTKAAFSAKEPEPVPAKPTLRERWRKLREELNKHERK